MWVLHDKCQLFEYHPYPNVLALLQVIDEEQSLCPSIAQYTLGFLDLYPIISLNPTREAAAGG